jgi:hypothetical protein
LGLDGWAEPLSGGDGRRGAAPEEDTKRRSKRGSARSSDERAIDASEQWSKWISDGSYGVARWCADRVNPNAPLPAPLYTSTPEPEAIVGLPDRMGRCWAALFEHGLCRAPMWAEPVLVAGPVSWKETGPLLLLYLLFYISSCISLQFKFSLILNSNLVSIPARICNPTEYFHNIVMINFMCQL